MQFPTSATLLAIVAALGSLPVANADCFKGHERRPKNNLATLTTLLVAAGNMEQRGAMPHDANVWAHSLVDNGSGGTTCLNWGVDNISGGYKSIAYKQAVQGLLTEWLSCQNGGKSEYKDGELGGWRFM